MNPETTRLDQADRDGLEKIPPNGGGAVVGISWPMTLTKSIYITDHDLGAAK
jgi:hypothetical protein